MTNKSPAAGRTSNWLPRLDTGRCGRLFLEGFFATGYADRERREVYNSTATHDASNEAHPYRRCRWQCRRPVGHMFSICFGRWNEEGKQRLLPSQLNSVSWLANHPTITSTNQELKFGKSSQVTATLIGHP